LDGVCMVEWEVKKVGECTSFHNGIAHENIVSDIGNFILITSKSIATELVDYRLVSEQLFPLYENDIVMVMSDVPNGRALAKCLLINKNNKYTLNQRICCFREHKTDARFLFYQLNRNKCFLAFNDGYSQTNLRKIDILNCEILIPPLPEQRRIAAVLSDTDALIAAMEKLIAKKRAIKQGAMQELLTGKRRLPGFSGKWVEKKLGDIIEVFDNLRIPVAESLREDGQTPYYGANGIQDYVKGYTHDGEFVLLAEDGANDLLNYPVNYVYGKVWVNNHAHVISGISGITNTKYLSYTLKIVDFQSILVGGTRAKLNGSVMRKIDITIPKDIEEQTSIASILSDMDAEIDALTKKLNKIKQIKQGMMSELLTGRIQLARNTCEFKKGDAEDGKNKRK